MRSDRAQTNSASVTYPDMCIVLLYVNTRKSTICTVNNSKFNSAQISHLVLPLVRNVSITRTLYYYVSFTLLTSSKTF